MAIQKQSYQIIGMHQDNLVGTGSSNKFAHEIMNMRLNTIGDYTTASWTTEKGTRCINIVPMPKSNGSGSYNWFTDHEVKSIIPIGQAVINDNWIIFGILENDSVILHINNKYENNEEHFYGRILYKGELKFSSKHPIETVVFYENEDIQKVYWTDGENQPRMINIKGAEDIDDGFSGGSITQFDFIQEVSLKEKVEINKDQSGSGLFPPCTVKYAITYYRKYGQETNIVYDSPLYYPTKGDRGCSPDELSGDSFIIKVNNIDEDHKFDYIRLYSIVKTSDSATPIVRIVEDKEISSLPVDTNNEKYALFVDTNTTGEIIDPTILQYIGGNKISIGTLASKDNVLFMGDIKLLQKSAKSYLTVTSDDIMTDYASHLREISVNFSNSESIKKIKVYDNSNDKPLQYYNQLNAGNSYTIKTFKKGETYRFGIQFQDSLGKWSEVIRLKDKTVDVNHLNNGDGTYNLAYATYIIPESINSVIKRYYSKARLICCYPNNSDRTVITQGIINPTVYNRRERKDGVIYGMSSWFFRPIGGENPNLDNASYKDKYFPDDDVAGSRNAPDIRLVSWEGRLPNSGRHNAEIQSLSTRNINAGHNLDKSGVWQSSESNDTVDNGSHYIVDNTLLTLNSPELDFDESIYTLPNEGFKIKLIGKVPINKYVSKYYIDADGVGIAKNDTSGGHKGEGFVDKSTIRENNITPFGTHDIMAGYWDDIDVYEDNPLRCAYPLYPFQRKGSLNNYMRDFDDVTQSAKLNSKVFATLMYSNNTIYSEENELNTNNITLYNSSENEPITIGSSNVYYGNMNSIVPLSKEADIKLTKSNREDITWGNYKLYVYFPHIDTMTSGYIYDNFNGNPTTGSWYSDGFRLWHGTKGADGDGIGGVSSSPIPLTYKSSPHYVFKTDTNIVPQGNLDNTVPYLNLVELTRDINNRFGGDNNPSNIYYPCGPAADLRQEGDIKLYGLEGDHYFMRYDCLKTYPYATDDTNQIVEILSFMCDSRINLDGRYDKNRCLSDNTYVNNTNFNLINKSYTQTNNTFSFTTLEDLDANLDNFQNQISWTNPKTSGEIVDSWTNITLASTADADGTLGKVNKLVNLNDKILLFQDHGLCQVNYNENTAISTEKGLPLELAKTGKFTGFSYITKDIGCQNKWSISVTKNGVLWIDDSRQELLRFGETIQPISTINGFDAFMIKELPKNFIAWDPCDFGNFTTFYDKLSNDVYYINKDKCIAWNEQSATFTSFYNYEHVPYMMNIGQHSLIWKDGVYAAREESTYSTFFNHTKDYWITIVCDGLTSNGSAFSADKVFNNIEYRADLYNINGDNINYEKPVFNIKSAWNGYQLEKEIDIDCERKFNTWRVQLPRASYDGQTLSRDRLRNPFCYIKLKQDQNKFPQTDRVILHDLDVYFDIR